MFGLQKLKFSETARDTASFARTGILEVGGKKIETPVFMPVGTRGSVKSLSSEDLTELGYQLILGNTYHLYLRPGADVLESFGGISRFMSFDTAILTDSGGFQVFSLSSLFRFQPDGVEFRSHLDGSKHKFTPELVLELQSRMGSNIAMVLDDCAPGDADRTRLVESLERTHRWAEDSIRARDRFRPDMNVFGIVQGGVDPELRLQSMRYINNLPFEGIALGGLSVGEKREDFVRVLETVGPHRDDSRPFYLMGVGAIDDILEGIRNGVDMFDCVLPTRNARNGQVFTSQGKVNLRNEKWKLSDQPIDPNCNCRVCKRYSIGYLRHLHHVKELLAYSLSTYHNLHFLQVLLEDVRKSIRSSTFADTYTKWKNLYEKLEFYR